MYISELFTVVGYLHMAGFEKPPRNFLCQVYINIHGWNKQINNARKCYNLLKQPPFPTDSTITIIGSAAGAFLIGCILIVIVWLIVRWVHVSITLLFINITIHSNN